MIDGRGSEGEGRVDGRGSEEEGRSGKTAGEEDKALTFLIQGDKDLEKVR